MKLTEKLYSAFESYNTSEVLKRRMDSYRGQLQDHIEYWITNHPLKETEHIAEVKKPLLAAVAVQEGFQQLFSSIKEFFKTKMLPSDVLEIVIPIDVYATAERFGPGAEPRHGRFIEALDPRNCCIIS